jgi:hypothetical protein
VSRAGFLVDLFVWSRRWSGEKSFDFLTYRQRLFAAYVARATADRQSCRYGDYQ